MRRPEFVSTKAVLPGANFSQVTGVLCRQRTQFSPRQLSQQVGSAEEECQSACALHSYTVHGCLLSLDHRPLQRVYVGSSVYDNGLALVILSLFSFSSSLVSFSLSLILSFSCLSFSHALISLLSFSFSRFP